MSATATAASEARAQRAGGWTGEIVDADVHVAIPAIAALEPHLPEFWIEYLRESNFTAPPSLAQIDPPNAPTACRTQWRPADGRPPASALSDLRRDVLDPLGVRVAIAHCYWAIETIRHPDFAAALARAVNDWLIADWLDAEPRLRAAIVVPGNSPQAAAEEIERVADHPGFVSVLLPSHAMRLYGSRLWHPMFEVMERRELVADLHHGGQSDGPPTPVGIPAWFLESHAGEPAMWLSQLTSVIAEGLFERFPRLRMSLHEGFAWLGGAMWRLDKEWKGLRRDIPWVVRPPSQTIRERVRISARPLDAGPPEHFANALRWIGSDTMLMFATDYPHAHDEPFEALLDALPDAAHDGLMSQTARAHYPRLD